MARQQSRGACKICGETFAKSGIHAHLKRCMRDAAARGGDTRHGVEERLFHLAIQDRFGGDYWLHLEMPASASLGILDRYLRDIWLECCGHLSEFFIGGTRYTSYDDDEPGFGLFELPPSESMYDVSLEDVLSPGKRFEYSYDFGSTTELEGRVVAGHVGRISPGQAITLLARNLPPQYPCSECGNPAMWFCPHCAYDNAGLYCQACAEDHECDWGTYDELMPVVNSPRTGVCAYVGGPLT